MTQDFGEPQETYSIEAEGILALPRSAEKTVLARKAVAAFLNESDTGALQGYGLRTVSDILLALGDAARQRSLVIAQSGLEPKDRLDGKPGGASLEAFCRTFSTRNRVLADQYDEELRHLVETEDFPRATDLVAEALDVVKGTEADFLFNVVTVLAASYPPARLILARLQLAGYRCTENTASALSLLEDLINEDDADLAAAAHIELGEYGSCTSVLPYTVVRHFESAGHLGRSDAALQAGRLWAEGAVGAPNITRAAANYSRAEKLGDAEAALELALLSLEGAIPYRSDWLDLVNRAAQAGVRPARWMLAAAESIGPTANRQHLADALAQHPAVLPLLRITDQA